MATLHNADDIARKDIREGDTVIIEKAGDVIPRVVGPVLSLRPPDSAPWQMPDACPLCQTRLHREDDEAVWRCENTSCPSKLQRGLEHFASRGAMNIEGLGESLIAQLLASGLVKDYADVYGLRMEDLAGLTATSTRQDGKAIERRFGEKNAVKVVEQIDRSREAGLARLLFGLGIRHVGERGAQVLAAGVRIGGRDCAGGRRAARADARDWPGARRVGAGLVRRAREPAAAAAPARKGRAAGSHRRRAGAGVGVRPAHRPDLRPHRDAFHDDPRGGHGGDRAAGRQGGRLGQQEDVGAWWWGPTRAARPTRPGRSAFRCSTRTHSGSWLRDNASEAVPFRMSST